MNTIITRRVGSVEGVVSTIEAADALGLSYEVKTTSTQVLGVRCRAWEIRIGTEEEAAE